MCTSLALLSAFQNQGRSLERAIRGADWCAHAPLAAPPQSVRIKSRSCNYLAFFSSRATPDSWRIYYQIIARAPFYAHGLTWSITRTLSHNLCLRFKGVLVRVRGVAA
jgi:hypothetical protein